MKLTAKQAKFVEEYLVDLNSTAAARRAGYSAHTADVQGPRLLGDVRISAAISKAQSDRSERTQINADWVLKRLAAMAEADLSELHNSDGSLKPVADWPEVWRKGLVSGFETEERMIAGELVQTRKVKLADRLRALELIGKHVTVGAWREKVEHSGPGGGPVQTVNMTTDEFRAIAAEIAGKV